MFLVGCRRLWKCVRPPACLESGKRSLGGRAGARRRCRAGWCQGSRRTGVSQAVHFAAVGAGQANHGDFLQLTGVGGRSPVWALPLGGTTSHHLSAAWPRARSSVPGTCFQGLVSSSLN